MNMPAEELRSDRHDQTCASDVCADAVRDIDRAREMSVINGAGCLGMVLGPAVAGIASAAVGRGDPDGYRVALLVAAGLAVLWLFAHAAHTTRSTAYDICNTTEHGASTGD